MRERHIWIITCILIIFMFIILAIENPLKSIIKDPRYVLLVIVTLLGLCFTLISIIEFRKRSLAYNVFDTLFDVILGMFSVSNLFMFLLGLVLLLGGIYGFIHSPDSIGMKKL